MKSKTLVRKFEFFAGFMMLFVLGASARSQSLTVVDVQTVIAQAVSGSWLVSGLAPLLRKGGAFILDHPLEILLGATAVYGAVVMSQKLYEKHPAPDVSAETYLAEFQDTVKVEVAELGDSSNNPWVQELQQSHAEHSFTLWEAECMASYRVNSPPLTNIIQVAQMGNGFASAFCHRFG